VVSGLDLGRSHAVVVELEGYQRAAQTLAFEPQESQLLTWLVTLVPDNKSAPAATTREADESPKGAGAAAHGRGREPELGSLSFDTSPDTEVRLGRQLLGKTPLRNVRLAPGTHTLQLKNSEEGFTKIVQVTVRSGRATNTRIVLGKGRLLVDAKPWADVYLRGKKIGSTPLPPIEVYEGDYKLKLVNPKKGSSAWCRSPSSADKRQK